MAAAVSYSQWKTGWVPGARPSPCQYSAALHCPVYWLSLVTHLWLQQGEALTDFIGWRLIRVRPIFRANASCGADNQEAISLVNGCLWSKCFSLEEISRKVLRVFRQDRTHSSEFSQKRVLLACKNFNFIIILRWSLQRWLSWVHYWLSEYQKSSRIKIFD